MRDPDDPGPGTPVMILTCAASPPDRLPSALREARGLVTPEGIVVIDGMVASDPHVRTDFDARRARLHSKWMPTDCEIAVYETHRRAWRRLMEGPWQQALVVEDDFRVRHPELVSACLANAAALLGAGRDIVKLFDFPRSRPYGWALIDEVAGIPIIKWRHPRAGMVAYLISRAGAEKFLARRRFFRVVDEDIKYYWELGLDIWSLPVNAIVDASHALGGSTIDRERQSARRRTPLKTLHGMAISAHRKFVHARVFGREVRTGRRRRIRYALVPAELAADPVEGRAQEADAPRHWPTAERFRILGRHGRD